MTNYIIKRDGRKVLFKSENILNVVKKALNSVHPDDTLSKSEEQLAKNITADIVLEVQKGLDSPTVEGVQDIVQDVLIRNSLFNEAKNFIAYRTRRTAAREFNGDVTKVYRKMSESSSKDMDLMRENANINGDATMGLMLRFGSEAQKDFITKYILKPEWTFAHKNGDFHMHDLDFSRLCWNCCQIDLTKLFHHGFSTGHGYLREPSSIRTASALACIALQSNQNDMFGGQSIAKFDYDLAPYVAKTFATNLCKVIEDIQRIELNESTKNEIKDSIKKLYNKLNSVTKNTIFGENLDSLKAIIAKYVKTEDVDYAFNRALKLTDNDTFQAMEALIHNLNTMQSRCLPSDEKVITLNVKKSKDVDKMSDTEREAFKDLIENLYKTMTIEEVANELNIKFGVMDNIFKKLNIKTRNKKENAEFMKPRWVEKFGVDNPAKNPEVIEKIRITQYNMFDGRYAFETDKQKQTMREMYGVENPMQNEDIKKRQLDNNVKKYGVTCTLQVPEIAKKAIETNKEKYGVENILCRESPLRSNVGFDKNPESIIKAHNTIRKNHGGIGMGAPDIRKKIEKTTMDEFGYATYPVYKDSYGIHESKGQLELYEIIKDEYPDIEVLKSQRGLLTEREGLEIDIWIPQLRIGIEYNGDYWHDRNSYENDIINETVTTKERVKDMLAVNNNITLIQIWESVYMSNKKSVIDYIFKIIDESFED